MRKKDWLKSVEKRELEKVNRRTECSCGGSRKTWARQGQKKLS
jgi:hypothetical protein